MGEREREGEWEREIIWQSSLRGKGGVILGGVLGGGVVKYYHWMKYDQKSITWTL